MKSMAIRDAESGPEFGWKEVVNILSDYPAEALSELNLWLKEKDLKESWREGMAGLGSQSQSYSRKLASWSVTGQGWFNSRDADNGLGSLRLFWVIIFGVLILLGQSQVPWRNEGNASKVSPKQQNRETRRHMTDTEEPPTQWARGHFRDVTSMQDLRVQEERGEGQGSINSEPHRWLGVE